MAKISIDKLKCVRDAGGGGPDQTYMQFFIDGDLVGRWPASGHREMSSGQTESVGQIYEFASPLTVKLWEYDSVSSDDSLGEQTFATSGIWGSGYATIRSRSEGSQYELGFTYLANRSKYVRLIEAQCVAVASGVDRAALTEVLNLVGAATSAAAAVLTPSAPVSAGFAAAASVLRGVPAVATAMDAARQDPDQLYITRGNARGVRNRIWPVRSHGQRA